MSAEIDRGISAEILQNLEKLEGVIPVAAWRNGSQSADSLEKLQLSLRAMAAAELVGSEPFASDGQNYLPKNLSKVVIHNREVADQLQAIYDLASFERLFELCRSNGVFAIKINDSNGLVSTAEAEENWEMSGRQWVTDTVRCGEIERSHNPLAWTKALLTLCDFYGQDEEKRSHTRFHRRS